MAEVKLDDVLANNSDSARRTEENKPPAPTEEFNPYVEEPVSMRKPSIIGRFIGMFGLGSNFEGAGSMVLQEVIIPTIIDGLRDSIYAATDYILYGGGQRSIAGGRKGSGRKNGYTAYSQKSQQRGNNRKGSPSASAYYFTFDIRADAEKVLEQMRDVSDQRDFVTIMDMFAIAKRQTSNYTYNDWGWYDLRSALVRRTNDGRYYLDLPKPVPIED